MTRPEWTGWTMKSRRRLVALLIFTSVSTGCLLLAVYGFLRSSYVQERVIASVRQPLAAMGVDIKFDKLSVDIFAGFNLVNLKLKVQAPPTITAELFIEKARLRYGFWALLRQRLDLRTASFKGIKGEVALELPAASEAKPEQNLSLEKILELIKSPPLTVNMPHVDVSEVKLHLRLTQGKNSTEFDIQESDVAAQVQLVPDHLKLQLKASLLARGQLSQSTNVADDKQKVDVANVAFENLTAKPDIDLDISTADGKLTTELQIKKSIFQIAGLAVSSRAANGSSLSLRSKSLMVSPHFTLSRNAAFDATGGIMELLRAAKTAGKFSVVAGGVDLATAAPSTNGSTSLSFEQFRFNKKWDVTFDQTQDFNRHTLLLDHTGELRNFKATVNKSSQVNIPTLLMAMDSNIREGQGALNLKLSAEKTSTSLTAQPLSLSQQVKLQFNLPDHAVDSEISTSLNDTKILSVAAKVRDEDSRLSAESQFSVSITQALANTYPALASLSGLGWPKLSGSANINVGHPQPWQRFKIQDWPQLDSNAQVDIQIAPTQEPAGDSGLRYKMVQLAATAKLPARKDGESASSLEAHMKAQAEEIMHDALSAPISLASESQLHAEIGQTTSGKLEHTSGINGEKLVTMTATWTDSPKKFELAHLLEAGIPTGLAKILKNPRSLQSVGTIRVRGDHKLEMHHPGKTIMTLKQADFQHVKATANLSDVISQVADKGSKAVLTIKKPISISTAASLEQNRLNLNSKIDGPGITLANTAAVSGMGGEVKATMDHFTAPTASSLDVDFGIKAIELMIGSKSDRKLDQALRDLTFKLRAAASKNDINISALEGGFKNGLLRFAGKGSFKTTGSGQLDGKITSRLLNDDSLITGSGHFDAPVKLILFDKQRVSLEANPSFDHLTVKVADFAIENLNGAVTILEELKLDDNGKIGFLYLKSQNPFARVDYENVEPYLEQKSQITFDKLTWKHVTVGPMVQNFEIRQNLVLLNDLKMDLLDGSILGRFYLDLHPSRLKTGFLGRFSGIKPELLKTPERRSPPADWAALAGRMAVDFDMRKRLASGRMDFTTIGKKQLLSLLDVLDPEFKDTQIALARNGLRLAYPKSVGVTMDHGLMDLSINLGGAINNEVSARSLPLSAIINSQAGEALSTVETMIN